MDRYRVVRDLQGGEFGMGRDFTIEQWRKNALEWCYSDDNYELAKELYKLPQEEVIEFISFLWALEFKKVRKDKKINQSDIEAYEDETLDEFYHARFGHANETYKAYEIACWRGKGENEELDGVFEYDSFEEALDELKELLKLANSPYKHGGYDSICLSTREQDEDGNNISDPYIWAEIDMNEFRKGEKLWKNKYIY